MHQATSGMRRQSVPSTLPPRRGSRITVKNRGKSQQREASGSKPVALFAIRPFRRAGTARQGTARDGKQTLPSGQASLLWPATAEAQAASSWRRLPVYICTFSADSGRLSGVLPLWRRDGRAAGSTPPLAGGLTMATSDGSLLTPKRVAELFGISRRTLYNWIQRGFFPQPLRLGPGGRTLRWTPTQIANHFKATREPTAQGPTESPGGLTGLEAPPAR
jgi:predicted DNA-binding transcriptional regulator AlpA